MKNNMNKIAELLSENRHFEMLLEKITEGILAVDSDGRIIFANSAVFTLLDIPEENLLGGYFSELFAEKDRKRISELMKNTKGRPTTISEDDPVPLNRYQVSLNLLPLDEDGATSIIIINDLSEKKRTERAHRETNKFLKNILDSSFSISIISTDLEQNILFWNKGAENIFGYTAEEMVDRQKVDILYREDEKKRVDDEIRPLIMKEKKSASFEIVEVNKDGCELWMNLNLSPRFDDEGNIVGILGVGEDISKRKQVEVALRKSEASLARAQQIAHLGNWDWDLINNVINWSDEIYRIFGLTPGETPTTYEAFLSCVHPHDRDLVKQAVDKALHTNEPFNIDHRVVLPDGTERIVQEQAEVSLDNAGQPAQMFVTVQDITGKKNVEEKSERQTAILEAINQVFLEALTCESDKEVACTCLSVAEKLTRSKFGFIGEVNQAGRFDIIALSDPDWKACKVPDSKILELTMDMEIHRIWERILKDEQSLIVNDPDFHPNSVGTPGDSSAITSFLGVPLKQADKPIGMIVLANKEYGYDLADKEAIEALSVAFKEALSQKRGKVALSESEEKYRSLVESTEDSIYLLDRDFRYLFLNSQYLSRLGIQMEEALGATYGDFHSTENTNEFESKAKEVMTTGKALSYEHKSHRDNRYFLRALNPVKKMGTETIAVTVVSKDITERKLAEQELIDSRKQLRDLSVYLQSVREQERTSIAREIHDDLGQVLTALKMDIRWLAKRLTKDQEPLMNKARAMTSLIDMGVERVQRITSELRPGLLDDLGLCAAIEWQLKEFKERTGVNHETIFDPQEITLNPDLSTTLFRIVQEALTNIARHANATMVTVSLTKKEDALLLTVADNGKGIARQQISNPKAFGLLGIHERARYWNGKVTIRGFKNKGTTISVDIPLRKGQLP